MHHPTDRTAHTTAFVTPVMEHWLEWEIAQWVHHEGLIRRPIAPWANACTTELHLAPMFREVHLLTFESRCCHIGYSFWWTARILLYAPSHRQDSTYHGLCYTSHGALAGTRNSSMGPPWRIDPTIHRTMSERSYHGATSFSHV